jgi:hypothetical protein
MIRPKNAKGTDTNPDFPVRISLFNLDPPDQRREFIRRHSRIADQAAEEAAIQFAMVGDRQVCGCAGLGEDHMAASLAVENPTGKFEGAARVSPADNW